MNTTIRKRKQVLAPPPLDGWDVIVQALRDLRLLVFYPWLYRASRWAY